MDPAVLGNKALVRRFYDEAINQRDLGAVDRLLSEDFTHNGTFLGVGPTNRSIEFTSTALLRLSGGLITQAWDEAGLYALMQQIGDAG